MNFKHSLLFFLRTEDNYEVYKSRMFEFEIWLWENIAFLLVCDCRRNHWEPLRVFKLLLMVQLMSKPIRIYDSVFWIKIILVLNVTQMYFTCKKELFFFFLSTKYNCLAFQLWETNWRINVMYKTFIHRWESVHIYMWKIEVQFYLVFFWLYNGNTLKDFNLIRYLICEQAF